MLAIYFKEIKTYFKSFFGWLFLAIFTFFAGLYFVLYNLFYSNPYLSYTVSALMIILLLILPVLTMRTFAEEKKAGTDRLLISSPISITSVVLGKFFALATILLISAMILVMGALVMTIFGPVPMVETVLSLLGFFLFGCVCVSIGMFLSSLTEHQFVAAILTYGVLFIMYLVPTFTMYLFGEDSWIYAIMRYIDITSPFNMLFGVSYDINLTPLCGLNLKDIIYIISIIALFLIMSGVAFGKNGFVIKSVGKKKFISKIAVIFILIAAFVGINVAVNFADDKYVEYDFTDKELVALTDDTKSVLDTLDKDITIYVSGSEKDIDDFESKYLNNYRKYSDKIKVEFIDNKDNPNFFNDYAEALDYGGLLVCTKSTDESGNEVIDKYRVVSADKLYVYDYGIDYTTGQYAVNDVSIDIEGQITSAISSLISDVDEHIYYLVGHGEREVPYTFIETIGKGGFAVDELSIMKEKDIPEDASVVLVNGPANDLNPEEIQALENYRDKGGKLILLASMDIDNTPNYDAFMEEFGVVLTEGTVIESNSYYMYGDYPYFLLLDPIYNPVTADLYNTKMFNFFAQTRGMETRADIPDDLYVEALYVSTGDSYCKVLSQGTSLEYEEGDEAGPFITAAYASKYIDGENEAEALLIGTPEFLNESLDTMVSGANAKLVTDTILTFTDVELKSMIPAKSMSYDPITVDHGMIGIYAAICLLILPAGFIIAGIVVAVSRRKK
ncbi:MAG: Gldg family protein [Lachnospiraceae bacterium]|nr:Gldg family protein [Lachnospiraceae bacterium]